MASILYDKAGTQVVIKSASKVAELLKAGYSATKPSKEEKPRDKGLEKLAEKQSSK